MFIIFTVRHRAVKNQKYYRVTYVVHP